METVAIKRWDYQHAINMLLAGALTITTQQIYILLAVALFSFGVFLIKRFQQPTFFGYANIVTASRLGLLLLLGFFLFKINPWFALVAGILILILDGIDGYLARRHNESSDFGAYLDMETDTFFVCLFCTYYYLNDQLGSWVLLVGFMRYIYVGLILLFNLQNKREKSTRFAKTIAVVLFSALLTPLILPKSIYLPAMIIATILVVYSFGHSFVGLLNQND